MALDMEATEATEVPLLTLEFTQGAMAEPDMGDKSKLKGCDRNFSYEWIIYLIKWIDYKNRIEYK